MPEISRFYGIRVMMFFDEHNPPHFHVQYNEYNAVIRIADLAITEGKLPPKAAGLIVEWALAHQDELIQDWELSQNDQQPHKIEPLK
ncbi:MAG: DUF4160 domain-containing protein [Sulfuricurvum sp.]|nr:DUF4160 domain-containing protein [Sulfuricurvum sp.]MDP3023696.1 DUF4160 domain-containing protein [Sulfuricurvum sp.]MDP3119030.1 DUF4160 domain-containing protein [Sulfuricurvum sp.]